MDEWKRRFPAVVVIQRIEGGKAAQAADIKVLERWASTWCKEHVAALYDKLKKYIRKLDSRAENWKAPINELLSGTAELYAAALAQDIQARHQRAIQVVWRWEKRYGHQVSGYLRTLGTRRYIHQLREVMPLRRVGDPVLEQRERIRAAKQASAMRKRQSNHYRMTRMKRRLSTKKNTSRLQSSSLLYPVEPRGASLNRPQEFAEDLQRLCCPSRKKSIGA